MSTDLTIVSADHPFDPSARRFQTLAFKPGLMLGDLLDGPDPALSDCCIIHNGRQVSNLKTVLRPGDVVHVYPRLHDDPLKAVGLIALAVVSFYVVGPAAAGFLTSAGMSAGAAGVWGTLAAVGTITAGGLLLNSMMPGNANHQMSDGSDSPTYGWQAGSNQATEGPAIPVIYGEVASFPHVINHYIEIDGNDQWSHSLLCVAEGPTNNIITAAEIYANNEPLEVYGPDNYEVYATDGSASPDTDELTKFNELHQMRYFNKRLFGTENDAAVLLNLNGTNGSTIIDDEGYTDNDWTCEATAALSTAHPFLGTASLDLETNGDYLTCDNSAAHDIFDEDKFCIEARFRQDALTDGAICGAKATYSGTTRYWGIFYKSGQLVYQHYIDVSGAVTVNWDLSGAVTLSVDTWHHVCVQRSDDKIYIHLDGVEVEKGNAEWPTTPAHASATWGVYLGAAYWWNGSTATLTYGNCEIDEYRVLIGRLGYERDGFTPPTAELVGDANIEEYRTQGEIDKFSIILSAGLGLYEADTDGSLDTLSIDFRISYRIVGGGNWTVAEETMSAKSRYPVSRQYDYTVGTRGQYDIRVSRLTDDSSSSTKQDHINWTSMDEILDEFLHYPYLQLVSVSVRAQDQLSGQVPVFRIDSNVSSISVPNFSGSGTQTVDPSNNAWAAFDMFTNEIYGAGISATRLVQADWEAWETWCDTTVDGYARTQINMIFDGNYDLDKALQHVENCGRAKIVNRGTSLGVVIEQPAVAAALFADGANIITGSGKLSFLPQAERADAVEITYRDKDANWQQATVVSHSAGFESLDRAPRIARLALWGINNTEQATREALFRRQISENIKRSADFISGIEALRQTVGDVINVRHDGNSLTFGGRLAAHPTRGDSYSASTVYLDREINLASATYSGNCTLTIRGTDDTLIEATVNGPFDTDTRYVTVTASVTVNRFDPYMITRASGEITQFKIAAVQRSGKQELTVRALQYVAASYYHSDYDSGNTPI